ncbi:tetratricopeptide repeat protein [Parabacteroides distasonis]|mgnify:FL=1|uniref:Tetratricopeptide repeat protein n=2 Tax=Parabacteroides distasonis TaxID=823 RepID=A0A7L5EK95_PARDI|nr:tetratricopeptide repeat protein [Parabacteroides distasonis]MDB9026543.1 tetratricopeptide repeat protein [Parabacteroides distasonis]MDB9043221.1 tetratricopeptide repeat protein [Parabacteroides distasonis]MDB9094355.1 tetratricopeptide repeat protein [Parabacteroides distasonis]MDB9161372.1 tetratricopeptide repeat protein [Parabacteroides distasonis]QJE29769.1 tetratricopeptide repeat protein [Parabacteroides distasonis]
MKRTLGLTLLLFATLFSCMRQEKPLPAELSRAESVMWEHPDSALSILRSMPQSSLSSGKNYATWALLLAQARDKVYGKRLPDSLNIPSSDELVQDAMDYFEKEDDLKRMAQAYYYKGQLLEDQKKLTEAIPLFLKSKDIMTRLDEPLFTYLICQSLGNTYRYQDLYEESLVQLKDAYQYALRSGNGERISYALSELGRTYVHKNEMDSALFYFGKSLENAKRLGNLELEAMAMGELGFVYGKLRLYENALQYIRKEVDIKQEISCRELPQAYYGLGYVFFDAGQLDSSKVYFLKSLETDNLYTIKGAYDFLSKIEEEQNKYTDAIYYNKQYRIYSDSIYVLTHTYDLAELQARYDHERLLNIANSLQMEKLQILKIALLLIICLLIIILFYQIYIFKKERLLVSIKEKINVYEEKIKENELLIEKNNARIDSLTLEQSKVFELNKINEDLKKQNRLLHEQIEKGKQSLSSYFVKLGDQVPYFYRLKRIRSCPHFLKEEDWSVIRIWVNLQYNQYADRLEKDFPEFTELDMQYCWLIKMGFTTSEIATCMAINSASSTKQKQRIKQRIKKSALVSQKDDFSLDQFIKEY